MSYADHAVDCAAHNSDRAGCSRDCARRWLLAESRFDGLAYPLITVRLANHKARASMDGVRRIVLDYDYAMPDGERFAVRAARALLAKVHEGDEGATPTVLIPCDLGFGKGFGFVCVPVDALVTASTV